MCDSSLKKLGPVPSADATLRKVVKIWSHFENLGGCPHSLELRLYIKEQHRCYSTYVSRIAVLHVVMLF